MAGRYFGHVAYEVDDIYAACQRLMEAGSPSTGRRATADGLRPFAGPLRSSFCRKAIPAARGALDVDAEHRRLVSPVPVLRARPPSGATGSSARRTRRFLTCASEWLTTRSRHADDVNAVVREAVDRAGLLAVSNWLCRSRKFPHHETFPRLTTIQPRNPAC